MSELQRLNNCLTLLGISPCHFAVLYQSVDNSESLAFAFQPETGIIIRQHFQAPGQTLKDALYRVFPELRKWRSFLRGLGRSLCRRRGPSLLAVLDGEANSPPAMPDVLEQADLLKPKKLAGNRSPGEQAPLRYLGLGEAHHSPPVSKIHNLQPDESLGSCVEVPVQVKCRPYMTDAQVAPPLDLPDTMMIQ